MRTPDVALTAAGSAGLALAVATVAAADGGPAGGEVGLFRAVNGLPDLLEVLLWPPMQLGARGGPVVVALAAAAVLRRWRPPLALVAAGFGAHAVAEALKEVVDRARPAVLLEGVHLRDSTTFDSLGFPSSHAATAFGLAAVAVTLLPSRRWRIGAWAVAVLVAIGRVHAGAHLPLDVVAGAAIGMAVGGAVRLIARDPAGLHP